MDDILIDLCDSYGWDYIDDVTLGCPCGNCIEHDGECDECGPSPLRLAGLI